MALSAFLRAQHAVSEDLVGRSIGNGAEVLRVFTRIFMLCGGILPVLFRGWTQQISEYLGPMKKRIGCSKRPASKAAARSATRRRMSVTTATGASR